MSSPATSRREGRWSIPADPVPIPNEGPVRLKLEVRGKDLQFFYALGSAATGPRSARSLDASLISDEKGQNGEHGSFTGGFVGVAASDLNGTAMPADFADFVYRPVRHESDRY